MIFRAYFCGWYFFLFCRLPFVHAIFVKIILVILIKILLLTISTLDFSHVHWIIKLCCSSPPSPYHPILFDWYFIYSQLPNWLVTEIPHVLGWEEDNFSLAVEIALQQIPEANCTFMRSLRLNSATKNEN